MASWTWVSASCQGTSHLRASTRKQDAFQCAVDKTGANLFVAVVADGAGSAPFGGEGASLASRTICSKAKSYLREHHCLPSDLEIESWVELARKTISQAAANRNLLARDFAATLICAITSSTETLILHIGDGSAVVKDAESSLWRAASWPSQGEYASTTFFITDEPKPAVKISRYDSKITAIAVFTDGIERLALNFAVREPHQAFFNSISKAVFASEETGRDADLSTLLAKFLNSEAVNNRTDDDKTLVIAVSQ